MGSSWRRRALLTMAVGVLACDTSPFGSIGIGVRAAWVGSPAQRVVQVNFWEDGDCFVVPSAARVLLNGKALRLTMAGGMLTPNFRYGPQNQDAQALDWPMRKCIPAYFSSDPFTPAAAQVDRIDVEMFGKTGLVEIEGLLAERSVSVTSGPVEPGQTTTLEWSPSTDVWPARMIEAEVNIDAPDLQTLVISEPALEAKWGHFQFRFPELRPGLVTLSVKPGANLPTARVKRCRGFSRCTSRAVVNPASIDLKVVGALASASPPIEPQPSALPAEVSMREAALTEPPKTPEDAAAEVACAEIARDIATLKPSYAQLFAFDATNIIVGRGECSIDYAYRTHRATRPGGWVAQVPNPDPDGVWFHIGIWDPEGPARLAQINTQPGFSVFARGDRNVTVLILDGASDGALNSELRRLLKRHGLGKVIR